MSFPGRHESRGTQMAFRPSVEHLEDRLYLNCSFSFDAATQTLLIRGDNRANDIQIVDHGTSGAGNVSVTCDGVSQTFDGVSTVKVRARGGSDHVTYSFDGPMLDSNRTIDIDAGNGKDTVTFNDTNAMGLAINSALNVRVNLGRGKDTAATFDFHDLSVNSATNFRVSGGNGKDTVNANFANTLLAVDQALSLIIEGGNGKDVLNAQIEIAAGSMGSLDVSVLGGRGRDNLTLDVLGQGLPTLSSLKALIDGGPGRDTCHHTDNVTVRNCEA